MASSSAPLPAVLPGGSPPPDILHTATTNTSAKRKLADDTPSERIDKTRRTNSNRDHPAPMYLSSYDRLQQAGPSQTFARTSPLYDYSKPAWPQSSAGPCPRRGSPVTTTRASTPSSESSEDTEDGEDAKNVKDVKYAGDSKESEDSEDSEDSSPELAKTSTPQPPTLYQAHQTSPAKGKGKPVTTRRGYVPYSFESRYTPVSSMDDVLSLIRSDGTQEGARLEDIRVHSFVPVPSTPMSFVRRHAPPQLSSDDCECTICVRALAKRLEEAAPFTEKREQLSAAPQGLFPWMTGIEEGRSVPRLYGPGVPPPLDAPWRKDASADVPGGATHDTLKSFLDTCMARGFRPPGLPEWIQ
ncbi:uncharacterized protein TRAVEDRAFT_54171 [Trametes versicolor FP-101664 SS1]|uniref:Uncharacterized protein n=1 Tax=Trametes versicolor (strain FP-101664) TaxID=717944 RepID=R7S9X0_TRAVS|nr:uncharacterized protein TRAVEDRAFT_54171 [Trametes versicolor FP-101664 SS1]EIW51744.1 hypothetical protein TRAVEDRAFT_54171 [Trametes versicolor FP-101664 SS1]